MLTFCSLSLVEDLARNVLEACYPSRRLRDVTGSILLLSDWVSLTNQISSLVVPNYIESVLLPILPTEKEGTASSTVLQQYVRVSLFNRALIKLLDMDAEEHEAMWSITLLCYCAAVVAKWATRSVPMWEHFAFVYPKTSHATLLYYAKKHPGCVEPIIENGVKMLQETGCSIYVFALERLVHTSNEENLYGGKKAWAELEKLMKPIGTKSAKKKSANFMLGGQIAQSDQCASIFLAVLGPFLTTTLANAENEYVDKARSVLMNHLQSGWLLDLYYCSAANHFTGVTGNRLLAAISIFTTTNSTFTASEVRLLRLRIVRRINKDWQLVTIRYRCLI